MPLIQKFGWKPDSLDHRDRVFKISPREDGTLHLPLSIDMRSRMPAPYNQGSLGSCTGNGAAAIVQFLEIKQGLVSKVPSRLWIYYYERMIEGTVASDSGAEIRDAIKVLASRGVPDEELWPYNILRFTEEPGQEAQTGSNAHMVVSYERLDNPVQDLEQMKNCLAIQDVPIIFGCSVYDQIMNVDSSGLVETPEFDWNPIGGHCMVICGYFDNGALPNGVPKHGSGGYFLVRNSWGDTWGIGGYCLIPYNYLCDPRQACDFWAIRRIQALAA